MPFTLLVLGQPSRQVGQAKKGGTPVVASELRSDPILACATAQQRNGEWRDRRGPRPPIQSRTRGQNKEQGHKAAPVP